MSAAETFAEYAAACRAVGRGGITVAQIRDLASREDGLVPGALEADVAALGAAAAAAEGALSIERSAIEVLGAAWRGRSGSAASDLLESQCATAGGVFAALTEAVEVLGRLRERLVRLLEAREEAGVRILDRRAGAHPQWLAWSRAVLGGTADDATIAAVAAEVGPYVETDIAGDWVAAMTDVTDSVAAAYREAVAILADRPAARFAIPSALTPTLVRGGPAAAPSGAVQPGAGAVGAVPGAPGPAPAPGSVLEPPDPVPFAPSLPALSSLPAGTVATGTENSDGDPELPDPFAEEPEAAPSPEPDPSTEPDPSPGTAPHSEPAPPAPQPAPEPVAEPVEPLPVEPRPAEPLPAEAGFAPPTPCEVAAGALPQVGE